MTGSGSGAQASARAAPKRSPKTSKPAAAKQLSAEAFAELVRSRSSGTGLSDYSFWYELLGYAASSEKLPARRGRIWA